MARDTQTGRYAGEPIEVAEYVVTRDTKQVDRWRGRGMPLLEIPNR